MWLQLRELRSQNGEVTNALEHLGVGLVWSDLEPRLRFFAKPSRRSLPLPSAGLSIQAWPNLRQQVRRVFTGDFPPEGPSAAKCHDHRLWARFRHICSWSDASKVLYRLTQLKNAKDNPWSNQEPDQEWICKRGRYQRWWNRSGEFASPRLLQRLQRMPVSPNATQRLPPMGLMHSLLFCNYYFADITSNGEIET